MHMIRAAGRLTLLFLVICLLMPFARGAAAQEDAPRIALVVGNGAYLDVSPLDNPVSDADLMASTLESLGFEVVLLLDADQISVNRAIAKFGRDLREAGPDATGLFYYAGHAVQSFGNNYLLPVDAALTDAADLSLVAVPAQAVLRQMYSARNKTNIVILDACRNNPFDEIPDLNDNGLAEMKAPTGTFLSYATAPGAVALDGEGDNSPFTRALATELPTPGLAIEQVFKNTRVKVIEATAGRQTPWDTSSLTGNFSFAPEAALTEAELAELQLWNSIKDSTDPVPVVLFMRSYPDSAYIPQARALLDKIINEELGAGSAATEVIPPLPEPKPEPEVVAAPAPEPEQDTTAEQQRLIGIAQGSGSVADYQAYLDAFPTGIFAEFAEFELKVLQEKADRAQAAAAQPPAEEKPEETVIASRAAAAPMGPELTWTMPFTNGGEVLIGKSLEQIVKLSPLYPPVEGLPEEYWKEQSCSNCHQWTKQELCDQGMRYLEAPTDDALTKKHPFGGQLKVNVKAWAEGGCK